MGERLKQLRMESGLKLREISEALNITIRSIIRYEEGSREPSIDIILKLCKLYNVSADYLLGIEDDFSENVNHIATAGLNDKEAEIIKNYRLSNDVGKTAIEITAESFAQKATSISKERRA